MATGFRPQKKNAFAGNVFDIAYLEIDLERYNER
jgi:hypothetical protein